MTAAEALTKAFQNFDDIEKVAILAENPDGSLKLAGMVEESRVHDFVLGYDDEKKYDTHCVFVKDHRVFILCNTDD